jgi:hypothetical protein
MSGEDRRLRRGPVTMQRTPVRIFADESMLYALERLLSGRQHSPDKDHGGSDPLIIYAHAKTPTATTRSQHAGLGYLEQLVTSQDSTPRPVLVIGWFPPERYGPYVYLVERENGFPYCQLPCTGLAKAIAETPVCQRWPEIRSNARQKQREAIADSTLRRITARHGTGVTPTPDAGRYWRDAKWELGFISSGARSPQEILKTESILSRWPEPLLSDIEGARGGVELFRETPYHSVQQLENLPQTIQKYQTAVLGLLQAARSGESAPDDIGWREQARTAAETASGCIGVVESAVVSLIRDFAQSLGMSSPDASASSEPTGPNQQIVFLDNEDLPWPNLETLYQMSLETEFGPCHFEQYGVGKSFNDVRKHLEEVLLPEADDRRRLIVLFVDLHWADNKEPERAGLELIRAARARRPDLCIVAFTQLQIHDQKYAGLVDALYDVSIDDLLQKEYSPPLMIETIGNLLKKRSGVVRALCHRDPVQKTRKLVDELAKTNLDHEISIAPDREASLRMFQMVRDHLARAVEINRSRFAQEPTLLHQGRSLLSRIRNTIIAYRRRPVLDRLEKAWRERGEMPWWRE